MIEIILSVIGTLGVVIPVILNYRLEIKKLKSKIAENGQELKEQKIKLTVLDRVLEITNFNLIKESVGRIFSETKADRFLILIAVNGCTKPRYVSVIFEEHKGDYKKLNAIARYSNIKIDEPYRQLLKVAENVGPVTVTTEIMEESYLRDFYELEGVNHSLIRHIAREGIDNENDLVVFSSLATHKEEPFTRLEESFIKTQYEGSIIPTVKKVINFGAEEYNNFN